MGVVITALLMNIAGGFDIEGDIERLARERGMVYPGEEKVIQQEIEEDSN